MMTTALENVQATWSDKQKCIKWMWYMICLLNGLFILIGSIQLGKTNKDEKYSPSPQVIGMTHDISCMNDDDHAALAWTSGAMRSMIVSTHDVHPYYVYASVVCPDLTDFWSWHLWHTQQWLISPDGLLVNQYQGQCAAPDLDAPPGEQEVSPNIE